MSSLFAMRRANGDWFAFDDHGRFRVPVFRSRRDAIQAHVRNFGMLLFRPVALDERAIEDIATVDDKSAMYFWLVDDQSEDERCGHQIEQTQLTRLAGDGVEGITKSED